MINKVKNIQIPKDEVLRYLGYKKQKIDSVIDSIIDSIIQEAVDIIELKYTLSRYNCKITDNGVQILNTDLFLKGNDIKNHLRDSKEVILLAATIGSKIEKRISFYEKIDLTKALIMDSAATAAIEELCDRIEDIIKSDMIKQDESIMFRYSPGYGDLPLSTQSSFLKTVNAEKIIGVTLSNHYLMMPRKSVTAIIGITKLKNSSYKRGCEVCKNYENCTFRKEGVKCGR